MEFEFDPYSPDLHEDPYPVYRRLRDQFPAHHNDALSFWTVSRYDDVKAALSGAFEKESEHLLEIAS